MVGTGEMVQWLRVLVAQAQGLDFRTLTGMASFQLTLDAATLVIMVTYHHPKHR